MAFGELEPSPIPTNPVRNGGFHHCERRITQPKIACAMSVNAK